MTTFLAAENTLPCKQAENVKILLERDQTEALLEVKGPYYIFNPKDGSRVTSGLLGKRFLVHATDQGIKWGETFLDIYQISVVPRSEGSSLLVNGMQCDGSISVYAKDGKIHIVNEVLIEDFIQSMLAKEFLDPVPTEVLSAVAILARTSACYYAKDTEAFWHINAKEIDYVGSFLCPPNPLKEVKSTKGLILVHDVAGKKEAFPATWTEHSAGKTASFSAIFRKNSPCPGICTVTPHALSDRKSTNWTFSMEKEELAKKCGVQQIDQIELFLDRESNKSYGVRITGPEEKKDLHFFELQKLLGKKKLQSNDFTVEIKNNNVVFNGYGRGHGVGLCLYSANLLEKNALEILTKFYPGTSLYNLSAKAPSGK